MKKFIRIIIINRFLKWIHICWFLLSPVTSPLICYTLNIWFTWFSFMYCYCTSYCCYIWKEMGTVFFILDSICLCFAPKLGTDLHLTKMSWCLVVQGYEIQVQPTESAPFELAGLERVDRTKNPDMTVDGFSQSTENIFHLLLVSDFEKFICFCTTDKMTFPSIDTDIEPKQPAWPDTTRNKWEFVYL